MHFLKTSLRQGPSECGWPLDQQPWYYLGTRQKCRVSGPTPDLLNENSRGRVGPGNLRFNKLSGGSGTWTFENPWDGHKNI